MTRQTSYRAGFTGGFWYGVISGAVSGAFLATAVIAMALGAGFLDAITK